MATDDNAPSEVSWQTAFFLLFSIAFVAISQPCGQFLGVHSKYRIWLRTSPFFCLADTLVIIAQFHYYSAEGDGPRNAMRRILQIRFASATPTQEQVDQVELTSLDPPELDIAEASLPDAGHPSPRENIVPLHIFPRDSETLSSVEQKLQLRFILGVFPLFPAIKLYTLIGIPWTQAFAAMYIASILSVEILLWCARPYKQVPLLPPLGHDIFTSNVFTIARYFDTIINQRISQGFMILTYITTAFCWYMIITLQATYSMAICWVITTMITYIRVIGPAQTGTSKTLLSFFCPILIILHSFLLFLYESSHPVLGIKFWPEKFHTILIIALLFAENSDYIDIQDLAIGLSGCMGGLIIILLVGLLSEESRHVLLSSVGLWEFLTAVVLCFLLLPFSLKSYHEYKYVIFATHNLYSFLLGYAYAYDATGTVDPSWEAIWG